MKLHDMPTVTPPLNVIFFAAVFIGVFYFFFTKPQTPEKSIAR